MYDATLSIGDFGRKAVLIIGNFPIDTRPFDERNLYIQEVSLETARNYFSNAKALIVADHPSKYSLVKKCFDQLFPDACNYGVMQKVLVHNEEDMRQLNAILGGLNTVDHLHYLTELVPVAEGIARHGAGPAPAPNIEIIGDRSGLDDEDIMLLRRAFFDCKKIHVTSIGGGKDSKHLLKVYAWMENSEVEAAMLPYFVKISTPQKIADEIANYRVFTAEYISFQYRPNCRIERCVSTENNRCLVGNFVDNAIPLRQALKDNHHSGIIHALFEKSLRGFRRRPLLAKKESSKTTLQQFIIGRIKIGEFSKQGDLIAEAKKLGLKSEVKELYQKLMAFCTEQCQTGVIHGDLHLGNVMVSGQDAIVIDFSGIKASGPLTADPATLEVSLCFDVEEMPSDFFESWRAFVDEVFNPARIKRPIPFTDEVPDKFSWLRRAVREVHHILIGCDRCKSEIESVIVCYLMRIARLAPKLVPGKNETEFRCRAYALVLAERIISFSSKMETSKASDVEESK